jgi:hypothetical protein
VSSISASVTSRVAGREGGTGTSLRRRLMAASLKHEPFRWNWIMLQIHHLIAQFTHFTICQIHRAFSDF